MLRSRLFSYNIDEGIKLDLFVISETYFSCEPAGFETVEPVDFEPAGKEFVPGRGIGLVAEKDPGRRTGLGTGLKPGDGIELGAVKPPLVEPLGFAPVFAQ